MPLPMVMLKWPHSLFSELYLAGRGRRERCSPPGGSPAPVGEAGFPGAWPPCSLTACKVCHLRKTTVDNSEAILPSFAGVSEINEICTLIYEDVLIVAGSLE